MFIELKMTGGEYSEISKSEIIRKNKEQEKNKVNNLKETRDNKGVYVGSGGSNVYSIRYPKKNRSKKVWDTFYKMFPWRAEKDGYKLKRND